MTDQFGNKKTSTFVWVALLWVGSFILGLWAIESMLNLTQMGLGLLGWSGNDVSRAGQGLILIIGIAYLAVAIGSFEYHRQHYGEAASWRLIVFVYIVEIVIVAGNILLDRYIYGA